MTRAEQIVRWAFEAQEAERAGHAEQALALREQIRRAADEEALESAARRERLRRQMGDGEAH